MKLLKQLKKHGYILFLKEQREILPKNAVYIGGSPKNILLFINEKTKDFKIVYEEIEILNSANTIEELLEKFDKSKKVNYSLWTVEEAKDSLPKTHSLFKIIQQLELNKNLHEDLEKKAVIKKSLKI